MDCRHLQTVIGTLLVLAISAVCWSSQSVLLAQTTTITPSPLNGLNSTRVTTRPNTTIHDVTGGTRPQNGPNLFHSFLDFSVGTNHIANFLNETALPTTNILSRVTGGNPSNIFGTIQTENFGTANLYLINPAGVLFGPTANLNVGGSFNASTADYLKMTDGARFYANPSQTTLLSIAPVAAFGFLNGNPAGGITVQGAIGNGQPISLVGRDVDGTPGVLVTGVLSNPAGRVNIASVGSPSSLATGGELDAASFMPIQGNGFDSLGTVKVLGGGIVVSGDPGGTVFIRGGHLVVEGRPSLNGTATTPAVIQASTRGTIDHAGTAIDIEVTEEVRLAVNDSFGVEVAASAFGSGNGGNIRIQADTLHLIGTTSRLTNTPLGATATIATRSFGSLEGAGNAGSIDVRARSIIMDENSRIQTTTFGPGLGGAINVEADHIILTSLPTITYPGLLNSFIASNTLGEGNAGSVNIRGYEPSTWASELTMRGNATLGAGVDAFRTGTPGTFKGDPLGGMVTIKAHNIELSDGAQISVGTSRGAGEGGSIEIEADSLRIDGSKPTGFVSGIFSTSEAPGGNPPPTGKAGDIDITSKSIGLTNQGEINASTFRGGPGGNILITTTDILTLDHGRIAAEGSTSSVDASSGSITIDTKNLSLMNSSSITVGSLRNLPRFSQLNADIIPQGNAGNISITGQQIHLSELSNISALTEGIGHAGSIRVNGNQLSLLNGSEISSNSTFRDAGSGSAGTVTIRGTVGPDSPAELVNLDNSTISTTIAGGSSANTPATISISANDLSLTNAAIIQADTQGAASAGNIHITARTLDVDNIAGITSLTVGEGNAGTIGIKAQESVTVTGAITISPDQVFRSTIASSSLPGASGDAGRIAIEAPTVTIADGATVTTTTFSSGRGGDATLAIDTLTVSNGGSISSGTFGGSGDGGSVSITANEAVLIKGHDQQGNKSSIAVASLSGTGDAGTLTINSNGLTLDAGLVSALTTGDGKAGAIDLAVRSMTVINDSQISSSTTFGRGEGGSLTIRGQQSPAAESLLVSDSLIDSSTLGNANAGQVTISAKHITFDSDASLSASTGDPTGLFGITGQGRAGDVVLTGNTIQLLNGSIVDSSTFGGGSGGSIHITATDQLLLTGRSQEGVSTIATITAGSGNAGEIMIETPKLTVQQGTIFANTGTSGRAGTITVTAGELSLLDALIASRGVQGATGDAGAVDLQVGGLFSSQGSTVSSAAQQGAGGNVSITAGDAQLTGGTTVSAESAGPKDSGNITLTSGSDLFIQNSSVTTRADQASGGDIKLTAPNLIRIVDSTITSSVQGEAGSNGGNINIDPQLVVIQNSQLLANANAGAGGNINVAALGAVLVDPNSVLSATAGPAGISGSVNINSPIQVLSGALVPMKLAYTQTGLSGDRCAADPKGQFSSFVQTGRDGAPQTPGGLASSPLGFLDAFQTSALETHGVNQTARLGLSELHSTGVVRFFSGCRS